MSEHGNLDGQELTDAEDEFWRRVYAGWRAAGCMPDQATKHAAEALRGYRAARRAEQCERHCSCWPQYACCYCDEES